MNIKQSDIKQTLKERRKDNRAEVIGLMILGWVIITVLFHFVGLALYWVVNN